MHLIKASIRFGVRPSSLILGKDSRKPWGKWDLLLAEAYEILEGERCPQCGLPKYICHNDSNDVQFRIREDSCSAMRAKDEHENPRRGSRKKKELKPGTVLIPEPYLAGGGDLSKLREPYYKAEAEKRGAEVSD